jgi:hypothetical protein
MHKKFIPLLVVFVLCGTLAMTGTTLFAASGVNDTLDQTEPVFPEGLFVSSDVCIACHNNLTDDSGTDVSFVTLWERSTMGLAAVDPYWRASVRKETVANPPDMTGTIQDICATCHFPMARTTLNAEGELASVLGEDGLVSDDHPLNSLALEGVSCLLCHQVQDIHLGEEESFDGGYVIDFTTPIGERASFGSFEVSPEMATVMTAATGFVPTQGSHIGESELCATCHDLITPFLDENDEVAGTFPEQMPYTEWQNSIFQDDTSCQDCHMPDPASPITLSTVSSELRENVGQHSFLGANMYMPTLLINAGIRSAEILKPNMELTSEFLSTQTAELTIENTAVTDGVLSADVVIKNLGGHKLPTAYPSRRVWIRFIVLDADRNIIFESGGYETSGLILGNANDLDPDAYEPHYDQITDSDQVQIYEPIMVDTLDLPTTTLLRGSRYIKDNRITPEGFDPATAPGVIAIRGLAVDDANFGNGMDTVTYSIDVGDAQGPFTIVTSLLYQPFGFRWAIDLAQFSQNDGAAAEIDFFLELYERTPNIPRAIVMTTATVE